MRVLDSHGDHEPRVLESDLRQVMGGMLVEDADDVSEDRDSMKVVSARQPSDAEWEELLFAWKVCRHVRSNAIVVSRDRATLGIGAGQMSRVDSVRLALEKARVGLEGSALASDAFFPFADGPELAMDAGVTSIIQPGGSIRDQDVIDAVDAAGAAMVFTGRRHFRH
jgi:phosphoribosylaminoimidazolecarboxamide formyltransferase/IMP cyclohydrolase